MDFWAHLDRRALFELGDVYRVGYDAERAALATVRVAVLGAGGVAQSKYLPSLALLRSRWEPVELVAVSSLDHRQAEKLSRLSGVPAYGDSAALLREHAPDAVLVTSTDDAHAELALLALEAGAHVLVEKPIASSLASAAEMRLAAEKAGRLLVTTCNKRYSPPYAEAHRLLEAGEVPRPALLSAKFVLGYEDVDLLASGTVHVFDLARHFMGDVERLSAVAGDAEHGHVVVTLEFESGAVGCVVTSSRALSLHPWERLEIFGENAWLQVEDQSTLTLYAGEYEPARVWSPAVPNTLLSAEEWGGYVGLLEAFLAGVRSGASEIAPGDGYRALELVVATRTSLAERAPVDLPLDPGEPA
jgi:predicted dehydrogenase